MMHNEVLFSLFSRKNLLVFLFIHAFLCFGQDVHYSQLSQSQISNNPAFSGIFFGPRVLAQYRMQYPRIGTEINSGYNTLMASFDQFIEPINSGVGVQVSADRYGQNLFNRTYLELIYAYQMKFNQKKALRIGFSGVYVNESLNWSNLRFYDQISPTDGFTGGIATSEIPPQDLTISNFNFNAGLLYFTSDYYIGISLRNMLKERNFYNVQSNIDKTMFSAQAGFLSRFGREEECSFAPYFLYSYQYGYHKLVSNFIFQYKLVNTGVGFRSDLKALESIIFILGFNLNKIKMLYSYDLGLNNLGIYSGGSHELGIRILIGGEDNSLSPNSQKEIIYCPDFLKN